MIKLLVLSALLITLPFSSYSQKAHNKPMITHDGKVQFINTSNHNFTKAISANTFPFSDFIWGDDYNISNNINEDSYAPTIALDSEGLAHVVYTDYDLNVNLQKVFYSKELADHTWTEPVYIDRGGEIEGRNNHYPSIHISSDNNIHVIYNVWAYDGGYRNYVAYTLIEANTGDIIDGIKISETNSITSSGHEAYHNIYTNDDHLPIVIWGLDNRANSNVEEAYLTYYNGTEWSDDILVSTPDDNKSVHFPRIRSIGNNKALIVFAEETSGNTKAIKYRIYDEITHDLSPILPILDIQYSGYAYNFDLSEENEGNMLIALYEPKTYGTNEHDSIKCVVYNIENNNFEMSSYIYGFTETNRGLTNINIASNKKGNYAITFADISSENVVLLEFDLTDGFATYQALSSGEELLSDYTDAAYSSPHGSLHIVWGDLRNDPAGTYVKRDIIHKKGIDPQTKINSFTYHEIKTYPNPSTGVFTFNFNNNTKAKHIVIRDVFGNIVYENNCYKINCIINLSDEKKGVYFANINFENQNYYSKIIIQ